MNQQPIRTIRYCISEQLSITLALLTQQNYKGDLH